MAVGYDPFFPEVIADPFPHYRWLRDEAPCHHVVERHVWVVSRYDDVRATLRDPATFCSGEGVGYPRRPIPMLATDPPEHSRLRRLVQRHFLPSAVAAWRPRVEQLVDELLDAIFEAEDVDLIPMLADPLPVKVIAELLGVSLERPEELKRWSQCTMDAYGGGLDAARSHAVEAEIVEFARFVGGALRDRAEHGTGASGDPLQALVDVADRGMPRSEGVFLLMLLLMAGNVTTTGLIGNVVVSLLSNPPAWDAITADPRLIPSVVEESLRFDAPTQGLFRTVSDDVVLHGALVPAGARVLVLYGSANRDERHYPDPDAFDLHRNPVDHVAFGSGVHACLGAPLARLEGSIVLERLSRRAGSIELAGDVVRTTNPLMRAVETLPLRVRAR